MTCVGVRRRDPRVRRLDKLSVLTAARMQPLPISLLTVCGLDELDYHSSRAVTHVLSILDPDWPEPEAFWAYDPHHRTTLHFHDCIEPAPGRVLPEIGHVESILAFGQSLQSGAEVRPDRHLLVHCHAGVSRSTAAMAIILAQVQPTENEDRIFESLTGIRPHAWPNSLMIRHADALLDRRGRLTQALARLYGRQLQARPSYAQELRLGGRGREVEMAIRP
jgi:predicted protein tyrosine phosphatase